LFDLIGLFDATTVLPARDSENEYTPRTFQLYEFTLQMSGIDGKAMSSDHALDTLFFLY
jgi:hypothetical protein